MVVLAASICTRGGKAILSRQFREIARSRVEGLLAAFPKLADSGTQHTTVEQDNVRYVYQPLDELYMVLITNRQSNILQDIDSLHLFAQVVTTICKSLDEREILRNAYELLSAFDEVVTLGFRENLPIAQIKKFLEMESNEERIQEIIAKNKELEATEARKDAAKRLEIQRRQVARSGRNAVPPPTQYPTYTPPARPAVTDTFDSYEAEKNKTFNKTIPKGKGMQLGKKSKTTDMFERVRGDMGVLPENVSASLVPAAAAAAPVAAINPGRSSLEKNGIHITVVEKISAKISREGQLKSFGVKGDLQLKISDASLTKVKLDLDASPSHGATFRTHPNVDKALFNSSKGIRLKDAAREFPVDQSVGVLKWTINSAADASNILPMTFTVWTSKGGDDTFNVTVEYELNGDDALNDVVVIIPFTSAEPVVASFDAVYEVTGDSLEWKIGPVDQTNSSGSFEFEGQTEDESEFFPMKVNFSKSKPLVDVDVSSVTLIDLGEDVPFTKEVKSVADSYTVE